MEKFYENKLGSDDRNWSFISFQYTKSKDIQIRIFLECIVDIYFP